jgi:hypothetical protein
MNKYPLRSVEFTWKGYTETALIPFVDDRVLDIIIADWYFNAWKHVQIRRFNEKRGEND